MWGAKNFRGGLKGEGIFSKGRRWRQNFFRGERGAIIVPRGGQFLSILRGRFLLKGVNFFLSKPKRGDCISHRPTGVRIVQVAGPLDVPLNIFSKEFSHHTVKNEF